MLHFVNDLGQAFCYIRVQVRDSSSRCGVIRNDNIHLEKLGGMRRGVLTEYF